MSTKPADRLARLFQGEEVQLNARSSYGGQVRQTLTIPVQEAQASVRIALSLGPKGEATPLGSMMIGGRGRFEAADGVTANFTTTGSNPVQNDTTITSPINPNESVQITFMSEPPTLIIGNNTHQTLRLQVVSSI